MDKQKEEIKKDKKKKMSKEEEYLLGWKRCAADFDNYKKRQAESSKFLSNYAKEEIIVQLLPILDNFEASVNHVPEESKDNPWVTGIMHIQKQLENILEEQGVKVIEAKVGDDFNPEIHEALQGDEENKGNKIEKIVQKGYQMGERIIRATKVIVK